MHTDEYEISIHREMTLCRKFIKRLATAISRMEDRYGMKTEALLAILEKGTPAENKRDFPEWRDCHLELQVWRQRLREYEEALEIVKQT